MRYAFSWEPFEVSVHKKKHHADQQLPERPDHCSLVFGEVLPAAWIEGAETPDDLQSASVGSGE